MARFGADDTGHPYDLLGSDGLVHRVKWNEDRQSYGKTMCGDDFQWGDLSDPPSMWVNRVLAARAVVNETPVTCLVCLVYVPGKDGDGR